MKKALFVLLVFLFVNHTEAAIKNVPANFSTIQAALNACSSFDTVLVQAGTYYENIIWPIDTIKGLTLLSVSGSQNTIIDGGNIDRVIALMGQSTIDPLITISGFTITNGELNTGADAVGAGLYLNFAQVFLSDLIISNNILSNGSRTFGAGISADSVKLTLFNCVIENNLINGIDWAYGCGLLATVSNTVVSHCKFLNNTSNCPSRNFGAGIYNDEGIILIESCEFKNNVLGLGSQWSYGAGVYLEESSAEINNCFFLDNVVDTTGSNGRGTGAAIYFRNFITSDTSNVNINFCTVAGNVSGNYAQIYSDGDNVNGIPSFFNIYNSIVWSASTLQIDTNRINFNIYSSNIRSSTYTGNECFSSDPLFLNSIDYHLSSISPCVNKASNTLNSDLDGNVRPSPMWHHADLGCYELDESLDGHTISGRTFIDFNINGVYDSTDLFYNNVLIDINQHQYNALSINGYYSIPLPDNNYTICSETIPGIHLTTTPSIYTINNSGTNVSNLDFGYYLDIPHEYEIETFITSQIPRCNTVVPYVLSILNTGIRYASGVFAFEKDPLMTIISSVPMYDSVVGNTYYWHYDNLPPFVRQDLVTISILMPGGGNTLNVHSHANALDSLGNTIDTTSNFLSQVIRCSFDPNLKTASPSDNVFSDPNACLTYTIYFQNTGNDTAFNVRLVDTLDALLDPTSFEVIESSHNYNVEIEAGNVVSFVFDNILLPDSNVNLAGSEGHITYRIRPLEVVPDFSIIQNTAYIYFDMNPSIMTNTTSSTIHEATVGVINLSHSSFEISAFPNPSSSDIRIRILSNQNLNEYSAELINLEGKSIRKYENLKSPEFIVSRAGIPGGEYFLRIKAVNLGMKSIKLVVY